MAENRQVKDIIDNFLNFRMTVRTRALEQSPKDTILLKECDNARTNLSTCGIIVKVKGFILKITFFKCSQKILYKIYIIS